MSSGYASEALPSYSYDDLLYPSRTRPETHPAHLAALGILYGLRPAPPESCRVLEIACADGGNLIPMAFRAPASEFVGIDLGGQQIEAGKARITELGLGNISLLQRDILSTGSELGSFDYIIAHGVFSWVAPNVRQRILALCAAQLSPCGIAYISYNVFPGWHLRGMIRQMLLYHTERIGGSLPDRVAEARRFLAQMAQASETLSEDAHSGTDYRAYRLLLEYEQTVISEQSDWYFGHDFLEAENEPVYFHQFVSQARTHRLQYLCEARYLEMSYAHYPAGIVAMIDRTFDDPVAREQYLDFLRLRTFRQSLLCRGDYPIRQTPDPASLGNLRVAGAIERIGQERDLASNAPERFSGPSDVTIEVSEPIGKAALAHLGEIYPMALTIDELLDAAREQLSPGATALQSQRQRATAHASLCDLLFKAHGYGIAELTVAANDFVVEPTGKPRVSPLAQWQAKRSRKVVNLRHEEIELDDDVTYYVLRLLDGEHDRFSLLHELASLVADGKLVLSQHGKPVEADDLFMESLEDALSQSIGRLARAALLVV